VTSCEEEKLKFDNDKRNISGGHMEPFWSYGRLISTSCTILCIFFYVNFLGGWCIGVQCHFQKYIIYIMAVSFIGDVKFTTKKKFIQKKIIKKIYKEKYCKKINK
jgi:hypothetical protein